MQNFTSTRQVYFLMQAVLGGELYALLKKHGKFTEPQAKFYVAQVAAVFEHLHTKDIIFRDLKPENLLIARDGYLRVVDFGLAKKVPEGAKTYTLCGTPAYAAPEVYASAGHNKGVDWWTLGVLLHELLAGYTPFYGNEPNQISKEIKRFSKHFPKIAFPSNFSDAASELLMGLLNPKPASRLGNLYAGAEGVKAATFFADVNWPALIQKQVAAEIIPKINDAFDTQNFQADKDKTFELVIDKDDESNEHEPWASIF
jgi:serine/threonine protein kinase